MSFSSNRATLLGICFIICIGAFTYANTMNVPFYLDDIPNIQNPALRLENISIEGISKVLSQAASHTRPVSNVSFALNYYFGGYRVQGYHFVNICIHLLTGIFLFLFLRSTLILPVNREKYGIACHWLALSTALLWLVHPLATQSVTYLVQRMNSMSSMFYMLALLSYVMGRKLQLQVERRHPTAPAWAWFIACSVSGVLAIGSKELAATLPAVIFVYEWYFFQDLQWNWLRAKFYWLVSAFFFMGILATVYLGKYPWQLLCNECSGRDFTVFERLLTQFRVVIRYMSLLLYPNPDRLALDYNFPLSTSFTAPVTTLYSFVGILVLLGIAVLTARRERLLSFCILWFFGNLVIESSVICLEIIFEHRTYLPSMLFVFVPVAIGYRLIKFKQAHIFIVILLIFSLSYWTVERNRMWQDPVLFLEDNVRKQPGSARAHNNYGKEIYKDGLVEKAEKEFRIAIQLNPTAPYPQINLGEMYWHDGKLQDAEKYFREAIRSDLTYMSAYLDLASILYETGRSNEAIQVLDEAGRLDPKNVGPNKIRGNILLRSNRIQEALVYLEKASLQGNNKDAEILLDQGEAYIKLGKVENAVHVYEEALKIDNRLVAAHYNLAMLYQQKGETGKAMKHFRFAVTQGNPASVPVQYNFANFLLRQQRLDEAKKMYEQFLLSMPYVVNSYNNLGLIYIQMGRPQDAINQFKIALRISPDHPLAKKNLEMLQLNSHD